MKDGIFTTESEIDFSELKKEFDKIIAHREKIKHCKIHKSYKEIKEPKVNCKYCWYVFFRNHNFKYPK